MKRNQRLFSEKVTGHRAIFPGGNPPSIFAAVAFHVRVREGVGVGPRSHRHPENCEVFKPSRLHKEKESKKMYEVKPSVC